MFRVGGLLCSFLTSKERDNESGLDYFLARYYSSPQGRFTSSDPINIKKQRITDPQRLNLYSYVRNNPFAYVDPTGEDLTIVITNIRTSGNSQTQSYVNHRPHGGPPRENVNTYKMTVTNESGDTRVFNVTRDTNYNGPTSETRGQYVKGGETPPGEYKGNIRTDGAKGFRIEIYDPKVDNGTKSQIQLPDGTMKEHAQIHIGPGCSEGCQLLTGGTAGRDAFQNAVNSLINEDNLNECESNINITIQPRNQQEGQHDEPDPPVTKNGPILWVTIPPKPPKVN